MFWFQALGRSVNSYVEQLTSLSMRRMLFKILKIKLISIQLNRLQWEQLVADKIYDLSSHFDRKL